MDNVVSLSTLFHQRLFQVPDYQRGYSWERQQVSEFLDDLELIGPGRFHYTGTVVLHESGSAAGDIEDEEGNLYTLVHVVDGQQRLTTIVILLDSIRQCLDKLSDSARRLSRGIRKNYVATNGTDRQPLLRLSLNQNINHFFKNSVLDGGSVQGAKIAPERRLEDAKRQIAEYLSGQVKAQGKAAEEWLKTLHKKVVTQLRFTLYQVENEAEVGVIFEVMNDRGKPLTNLEKVKNLLLHASVAIEIDNKLDKDVNDAWASILTQLMTAGLESADDEDRLLRAHWLAYYDHRPRHWSGSRSIKGQFDLRKHAEPRTELLDELHRYVEGLRESSVAFCDALRPTRTGAFESFSGNPKTRVEVVRWSDKLRRIGVMAPFLPLLIAARERWPDDAAKYLEIVKLCEAYAFRVYRLQGARADTGQSSLSKHAHDLAHKQIDFHSIIDGLKGAIKWYCDDTQFKSLISAEHHNISAAYFWRGIRYFLYEYETTLAQNKGASPKVSWDELQSLDLANTIEHILPVTIEGKPEWQAKFQNATHKQFLHDLGNLTLTKHNSSYSNKEFAEKKGSIHSDGPCYTTSPMFMEQEVAQWRGWTPATIEERRDNLLSWARKRWAVDLGGVGEAEEREPEEEDGDDEG